jgi:hypothetical protein
VRSPSTRSAESKADADAAAASTTTAAAGAGGGGGGPSDAADTSSDVLLGTDGAVDGTVRGAVDLALGSSGIDLQVRVPFDRHGDAQGDASSVDAPVNMLVFDKLDLDKYKADTKHKKAPEVTQPRVWLCLTSCVVDLSALCVALLMLSSRGLRRCPRCCVLSELPRAVPLRAADSGPGGAGGADVRRCVRQHRP